jgi:hypothetical protein
MIRGSREACAVRVSEGVSVFVWATRDAESEGGGLEDGPRLASRTRSHEPPTPNAS